MSDFHKITNANTTIYINSKRLSQIEVNDLSITVHYDNGDRYFFEFETQEELQDCVNGLVE